MTYSAVAICRVSLSTHDCQILVKSPEAVVSASWSAKLPASILYNRLITSSVARMSSSDSVTSTAAPPAAKPRNIPGIAESFFFGWSSPPAKEDHKLWATIAPALDRFVPLGILSFMGEPYFEYVSQRNDDPSRDGRVKSSFSTEGASCWSMSMSMSSSPC